MVVNVHDGKPGPAAEREVGQDFDEERLPCGDGGAVCSDGDWAEQCQTGTVALGREPVPDILVQVGVRAFDLSSDVFRDLRVQLLEVVACQRFRQIAGCRVGFEQGSVPVPACADPSVEHHGET